MARLKKAICIINDKKIHALPFVMQTAEGLEPVSYTHLWHILIFCCTGRNTIEAYLQLFKNMI